MGAIVRDEKGHFKGNGKKTAKQKNDAVAETAELPALISQYVAQLFKQKYGTDIPKNAKIEIVNLGKALTPEQLAQKAAGLESQNSRLKSVIRDLDERHNNMCKMLAHEKKKAELFLDTGKAWENNYKELKKKSENRFFWFTWAAFVLGQVWLIILTIVMRRYGITF